MKKTILLAALCLLAAGFAEAKKSSDVVSEEKVYVSLGAQAQFSRHLAPTEAGAQIELGWWFCPYLGVAVDAGAFYVIPYNHNADAVFTDKQFEAYARFMGLMDFTNVVLGREAGTRAPVHIAAYAGLGQVGAFKPMELKDTRYWLPSVGLDLSARMGGRTRMFARAGVNIYHPLHNISLIPEVNAGLRFALGTGRKYSKNPEPAYKEDMAAIRQAIEDSRDNVKIKTETVVRTDTVEVEVEVEKVVRDTVTLIQYDTLTIYDVVELGQADSVAPRQRISPVKALANSGSLARFVPDTVFVETFLIDTVFVASDVQVVKDTVFVAVDAGYQVQTDTVFIASEPEIQVRVRKDTVWLETEPEIQIQVQTDTVFVESDPEVITKTVYVNTEPVVIKDTVFVASDPEVKILTVYRDKEPVVLKDTVFVQSEPEIQIRTVYKNREVVRTDTVYVASTPEIRIQKDTVWLQSEPEVKLQVIRDTVVVRPQPEVRLKVQKDTVYIQSEPEIQTRTVYVNREPVVLRDTVFVASDPEVLVQTVYRDKEPIVLRDTVYVQSEPEIQVRTVYKTREVVKTDTVFVKSAPEVKLQIQKDTVYLPGKTVVKRDTVILRKPAIVQIDSVTFTQFDTVTLTKFLRDTVTLTKTVVDTVTLTETLIDTVTVTRTQTDTVFVKTPGSVIDSESMIYVVFPENAAWVNYGARKQLDKLAKEIKAGDVKYMMIAPVSPDSPDAVKAYNLGVRRVSQVRLHLIRENGVDSRRLAEKVVVSSAGIPVEDGNAFVIVAREDDPRIAEFLAE